ncbi:MAG: DUF4870 domain-containing protein [Chloroflexi bacterium]|nr:DUF4870 domain-containing protein [Chloroflexota bacterium]
MLRENTITRDERLNATLAHASILLGVFSRGILGVVLAALIWITQRGKSNFAARHALQATVYQLLGIVIALALWIGWGVLFTGSIFVPVLINPQHPEPLMAYTMIPAFGLILAPFAVMFAWFLYGLYAAWQVWHGKDFSYWLIGEHIK